MRLIIALSDAGGSVCCKGCGMLGVSTFGATCGAGAGGVGCTGAVSGTVGVEGAGGGVSVSARAATAAGVAMSAMAMR